jgi:hypothetical protein
MEPCQVSPWSRRRVFSISPLALRKVAIVAISTSSSSSAEMVPWMSLVAKISMVVDPVVGLTGVLLLDG